MRKIITSLLAVATLAAPAIAARRDTPDVQLTKLLAGRVAGKPQNCLPFDRSQSSIIIPGKAIVYRVGSTLWVNEPRSGASSLRDDDILVTRLYGTQLCSIDTVNLVDRASRFPRGFVILGQFTPYKRDRQASPRPS